jgi:hypothetical protein
MQLRKKTQADIEGLQDLRMNLDNLCRYQAKWAPEDYDLKNARYPPRDGRITDLIAWRKGVTASGWESSDDEDDEGEEDEEDEEGEEEREDREHQIDTSKHSELEDMLDKPISQKNDGILPEDPLEVQAAEDEIFGKDLSITDIMKEAILEERRKEATPAGEAKDKEGEQVSKDEATEERGGERQAGLRRRQLLQDEYDGLQLRVDAMRARQRDIAAEMEKQN